ncbi:MAG: hypothetical protein Q8Q23_05260 [bacterium]|nr:hypothetical protein [bacterium]
MPTKIYKPAKIRPENIRLLYTPIEYIEAGVQIRKESCEKWGLSEVDGEMKIIDCKKFEIAVKAGELCGRFDNACQCERCEKKRALL